MRNALEITSPAMVHIAKITSSITHPLVFVVLLGAHVTVFGVACQAASFATYA